MVSPEETMLTEERELSTESPQEIQSPSMGTQESADLTETAAREASQTQSVSSDELESLQRSLDSSNSEAGVFTEAESGEMYGYTKPETAEVALRALRSGELEPATVKQIAEQLIEERAFDMADLRAAYVALENGDTETLTQLTADTLTKRMETRSSIAEAYDAGLINNTELEAFKNTDLSVLVTHPDVVTPLSRDQLLEGLSREGGYFHNMDMESEGFGNAYKFSRILPAIEALKVEPGQEIDRELLLAVAQKLMEERVIQAEDEQDFIRLIEQLKADPENADPAIVEELYKLTMGTLELKMVQAPEVAIMRANGIISDDQLEDILNGESLADYKAASRGSANQVSSHPSDSLHPRSFLSSEIANDVRYEQEIAVLNALTNDDNYSFHGTKKVQTVFEELGDALIEYGRLMKEEEDKEDLIEANNLEYKEAMLQKIKDLLQTLNVEALQIDTSMQVQFGNPDNPLTFYVSVDELTRVIEDWAEHQNIHEAARPLSTVINPSEASAFV